MYDTLTVDWNLGNSCNLKCNYCHWELNNGENPFPLYSKLSSAVDHLLDQSRAFSYLKIQFTGGEPTESDDLKQVIIKNKNKIKFKLCSNGLASLSWWDEIKDSLYGVELTYHLHTDLNHFVSVVKILNNIDIKIFVAVTPEFWQSGMYAYKLLKLLVNNTHIQLLYKNLVRGNNLYLDYTVDQWEEYYKEQNIDISNSEEITKTIEFKRANNLNNFYGHLCYAGFNQIVIDNFGDAYRGWCKSNRCLGNIYQETLELNQNPSPCPRRQCRNSFDLEAYKSKGSWGIA